MLSDHVLQSKGKNLVAANGKLLREMNTETILRVIRERQPISRSQIAKLTGLTKATVTNITAEMLDKDLIFETSSSERMVGRNPVYLSLKLATHFVGAIDIDLPSARIGVVDVDGTIRGKTSIKIDQQLPNESIAACVEGLKKLCTSLNVDRLEGIGISVPGTVDPNIGLVKFTPGLRWRNFNMADAVRKLAPEIRNVSVGNGANLLALAEVWFGTQEVDLSSIVFISIYKGVGSGIVIENKLLEGNNQAAGEFGHMVIHDGGESCQCGKKGCLEAYASDSATVKRYISKISGSRTNEINYELKDIIGLAENGDAVAIEALKQTGYYLGVGISNIINAIDPNVIIIGGEITRSWDLVYPEIMRVITEQAYFGMSASVKILPTSLSDPPRVLGAATLALERMFSDFGRTESAND